MSAPDQPRYSAATPLRIGTRASPLALWQTEHVRTMLAGLGWASERVEIRTTGDVVQDVPLARIGSVALFTRQLDEAMLAGRIDAAVHSLKDLPTRLPDGIVLAAVGSRADPRDALVGRTPVGWSGLPAGARIATSSLRRRAQLLHARPDLEILDIRGNVDTRLRKLEQSDDWAGILLAAAGLERLGLGSRISDRLPASVMLPAPGQGALAVTVRADDSVAADLVREALHDEATALATAAERAFLRRLEGGCQAPIAALGALNDDGTLRLRGRVLALDGAVAVEGALHLAVRTVSQADQLGEQLAEQLLADGADEILARVRAASDGPAG